MHTRRALGLRFLNAVHSRRVAVPVACVSIHDWLSDTYTTSSPAARRLLSSSSGALQLVPPPPSAASFSAFDITLSRALSSTDLTHSANGRISARGFLRRIAADTSAAT